MEIGLVRVLAGRGDGTIGPQRLEESRLLL